MFKPLNDSVIIKRQNTPQASTEVIVPDSIQEDSCVGTVIAVGPGVHEFGQFIPSTVKKGDVVVWSQGLETKLVYGTEKYVIVHESNLLTIVEDN